MIIKQITSYLAFNQLRLYLFATARLTYGMPSKVPTYITTIIVLPLFKAPADSTEFLPRTALLFVVDNHIEQGLKLCII
jgi:hypothetical protein